MKKYISVFSVIARESMVKISVLWVISAVLQAVIFVREMVRGKANDSALISYAFDLFDDKIGLPVVFGLTIIITGFLLMKTGMEFRTRTGYTLRRLRITERQAYVVQSVYNCFMLFMLFVFETALCFFLVKWGTTRIDAKLLTSQTVYLTFYTTIFLKEIFAGRNIVMVIRNLFFIAAMGFNLSAFSYLWRRGSKYVFGVLVLVAAALLFIEGPDWGYVENITVTVVSVGILLIAIGMVRSRRKEYDG